MLANKMHLVPEEVCNVFIITVIFITARQSHHYKLQVKLQNNETNYVGTLISLIFQWHTVCLQFKYIWKHTTETIKYNKMIYCFIPIFIFYCFQSASILYLCHSLQALRKYL